MICSVVYANSTVDTEIPFEDVILKAPDTVKMKKPFVLLSHETHKNFSCSDCHHTEGYKNCTSSGCHDLYENKDKKDIKHFYTMYHNNCYKGCHNTLKKEGLTTGPTTCNGCHIKEK